MEILVVNLSEFCGGLVDVSVGLVIDYDRYFCFFDYRFGKKGIVQHHNSMKSSLVL